MSDLRRPIFIGGLPGSGKTPVRRVLGAHPTLCMTRKTYLWTRYYDRFGDLAEDPRLDRCLSTIVADSNVRRLQPDCDRLRREFRQGPPTYARLFGLLHMHHAQRLGCTRWGEQLGEVERYTEAIFAAFPDARMIHMLAAPRQAGGLGPNGLAGPLRRSTAFIRSTRSAQLARRNSGRFPDRYRVVRAEELASRPRGTVDDLCRFLGLEFVPEMERVLSEAFDVTHKQGSDQ